MQTQSGTEAGLMEAVLNGRNWAIKLSATNMDGTFDVLRASYTPDPEERLVARQLRIADVATIENVFVQQMHRIVMSVSGTRLTDFVEDDERARALQIHVGNSVKLLQDEIGREFRTDFTWHYVVSSNASSVTFTFTTDRYYEA